MNSFLGKMWKQRPKITVIMLTLAAFAFGYFIRGGGPELQQQGQQHDITEERKVKFWTCSMHPQIRQPGPGQCPICAMDLIPITSEGQPGEDGLREHTLSKRAMKLAEIRTAPVEKKFVTTEIRMDGKIDYDETRLAYVTAWFPGRIEKLFVDYTGVAVKKGDHMVSLYSPELITAQQELLLGLKMLKGNTSTLQAGAQKNLEATREKLRLWGLTDRQIRDIEKSGKVSDRTTIFSSISGIVINKNGFEGMYVETGTRIYTVADLSQVWIKLDAYESDLVWIRYGQEVQFETKAYPGEVFVSRIAFIDPILNPATRTVKVRVNVPNLEGKLKPEMFVSALVFSKVAMGGKVMEPALADKWICPMHPDIVKDTKNMCPICGMPLVTTESLGYVPTNKVYKEAPLVIPATAPLITGKRAVVYVAIADKEGTFEGREVTLGPKAGDYYIIKDGLVEDERVVVHGNFKIDSAIQILAKPSMMSPEGGMPTTGHQHQGTEHTESAQEKDITQFKIFKVSIKFKNQIESLVLAYFDTQEALSQDDFENARKSAKNFLQGLDSVNMRLLEGPAHMAWMTEQKKLKTSAESILSAKDITVFRSQFDEFSDTLYSVLKQFGTTGKHPIFRFFCPMANNNKGAYWLQRKAAIGNPYFGKSMFKCGRQTETLTAGVTKTKPMRHDHE